MKTCAFETLGCKVNQYETQAIRETLLARGLREVSLDDGPDLFVLNTCTITHQADRSARSLIRRAYRNNPAVRTAVTGCLATRDPARRRSSS